MVIAAISFPGPGRSTSQARHTQDDKHHLLKPIIAVTLPLALKRHVCLSMGVVNILAHHSGISGFPISETQVTASLAEHVIIARCLFFTILWIDIIIASSFLSLGCRLFHPFRKLFEMRVLHDNEGVSPYVHYWVALTGSR